MGQLNCQAEIADVPGLEANQMTVGRHLALTCNGEPLTDFNFADAKLAVQDEVNPAYRLFKAEAAGAGVKLDLTVYKAGEVNLGELTLTDGTHQYQLTANAIKVVSVLKAPAQGEKPQEPFGPIFPVAIEIPSIYLISLGLAFVLVILAVALKIRNVAYNHRLKLGLRQYDSPISPDTQFYRSIRVGEKKGYELAELEKAFMLYNVRSYKIPLFELSSRKALKYFKAHYPQCKKTRIALDKFLTEFDELNKRGTNVSAETKHELVKKMYRYIEAHRGLK